MDLVVAVLVKGLVAVKLDIVDVSRSSILTQAAPKPLQPEPTTAIFMGGNGDNQV